MKYLKYNEASKINKLPLTKDNMEDLLTELEDEGINVRLAYGIESEGYWLDLYEYPEIVSVEKVGWIIEFYFVKYLDNINNFNDYFKVLNKMHYLVNRVNNHFDCRNIRFNINPENFDGVEVTIERTPTIQDVLEISLSYLKTYSDELVQYKLNIGQVVGDAISFTSELSIEDFTKSLKNFEQEQWTLRWKNITQDGDLFLVHGLAVYEIRFKY